MNRYIATFHTHVSALLSNRSLEAAGVQSRMAPVPRKLSSSCGTCVFYEAEHPRLEDLDGDVEAVYRIAAEETYEILYENR